MTIDIDEAFRGALTKMAESQGRGFQTELAERVGVSPQYIWKLLKQKSYGSEAIRRRIAAALGYGYEEFLSLGSALGEGATKPEEAADAPEIRDLLRKTRGVLLSPHADIKGALSSNIETFYRAVEDREAIHRLELNAQAQNARLEALEKKMSDAGPPRQNTGTEGEM
jgi:transcriptional regulator with XRE-family HTH domain